MGVRQIEENIGEAMRVRMAAHALRKLCAGRNNGTDGRGMEEVVRRLADGQGNEEDKNILRWAMQGARPDQVAILGGWGGIGVAVLAAAGGGEGTESRITEQVGKARIHGKLVCRSMEDMGPELLKAARRKDLSGGEKREETIWFGVGVGAEIGVPREVVEEVQKEDGRARRDQADVVRQHHIPRWLSRGFLHGGKTGFRVYTNNHGVSGRIWTRSGPRGWGAEEAFYNDRARSMDRRACDPWDYEDGWIIDRIRNAGMDQRIVQKIPRLLTRLILRRKTTRKMIEARREEVACGNRIMDWERDSWNHWRDRLERGAEGIREVVAEDLRRMGVPEGKLDEEIEKALERARESARKIDADEAWRLVEESRTLSGIRQPDVDRAYHLDMLEEQIEKDGAFEKYCKRMRYCVFEAGEPILILGDSVVVEARVGKKKAYDPLEDPDTPLESVYLPIRSDLILVGLAEGHELRDAGWIIAAGARLSRESFIGADVDNKHADAEAAKIGMWREEINEARGYKTALESEKERDEASREAKRA